MRLKNSSTANDYYLTVATAAHIFGNRVAPTGGSGARRASAGFGFADVMEVRMIKGNFLSLALCTGILTLTYSVSGQLVPAQPSSPPWSGIPFTLNANMAAMSNPQSTQEELPGLGHKFELLFSMNDDKDPQNRTNDVISVLTTTSYPAGIGVAFRDTPPGFKIAALTNQLQLKYYFPMRSCGGGSPRIQIAIDTNGDGTSDGNAFGYVGHSGFGGGCITGAWDFVDMTDLVPARWDLTQFGLGYHNWQTAVAAITTAYPNHKVLSGSLVDDSCSFAPSSCGQAYYDLFTFENRTLEQDQDTVKNGN